ncbi:TPA: hypothetical protein ACT2FP_001294 [Streptococcus suis]|uniref:hypothetical protein n=1 Tax=Streptococcus suis TaxID=1307 RepID=UPI00145AEABC|nr:hypothetical protein [Streptococcus suis]MBO4114808.1 hypothetical protein [Streptococcus suis]
MKKIILLISLLAVTLNTSPALANQRSEFNSKQTNIRSKTPPTKLDISKDLINW